MTTVVVEVSFLADSTVRLLLWFVEIRAFQSVTRVPQEVEASIFVGDIHWVLEDIRDVEGGSIAMRDARFDRFGQALSSK